MKIAVYPGSFDPITIGHMDILGRALEIFDKVIVGVAINPKKKGVFPIEERIRIIQEATKDMKGVEVDSIEGLTVNYAKKVGAVALIRGLRAVTDFEYEFQLSAANTFADSSIETVFFMSRQETTFISSSAINELYSNGVDISSLVPPAVMDAYQRMEK